MNISFEGINQKSVTFLVKSDVMNGEPVKISENMTAASCDNGEVFAGIAGNNACDGAVAVVINGYVTVPYTGSVPSLGYTHISADGSRGVKTDVNGRAAIICEVDTVNTTVGMFI